MTTTAFTTTDDLVSFMRLSATEEAENADLLDACVDAVNEALDNIPGLTDAAATTVPAPLTFAANLRAAWLYGRTATPLGLTNMGGMESAVYVPGQDRDFDKLIGPYKSWTGFA